jgi:general secretion pathway protein J
MTAAGPRHPVDQGFTLLELLVAITLLGLLMAALFGSLRLGARVWETGEARLDASARVQIVQDFLRQRLAEALPLEAVVRAEDAPPEPLFAGGIEAVRFANVLPEHLGAGLYLMELALAEDADGEGRRNLVLRWQPLDLGAPSAVGSAEPQERVLLDGVEGLELAYFGSIEPRLAPEWWPQWEGQDVLPGLVRVQVRFAAEDPRSWPELDVHPMVDLALQF